LHASLWQTGGMSQSLQAITNLRPVFDQMLTKTKLF
jgi:hypothetical protein